MSIIPYSAYSMPNFADKVMSTHQNVRGKCKVELADKAIRMPVGLFLVHTILWRPLFKIGYKPTIKEVFNVKTLSTRTCSKIQTILYEVILDNAPNVPHMEIAYEMFLSLGELYNFTMAHANYMPPLDLLGIAKLMEHPRLKELSNTKLKDEEGTPVAEARLRSMKKEVIDILSDPNTPNNCLYPYIKGDTLNTKQVIQTLFAYGPRADINNNICKHIVAEGSYSGLKSVDDYAIDYLSAKIAACANRSSIKDSQTFNRKVRLSAGNHCNIHPGWCGSESTIPLVIPKDRLGPYTFNTIEVDGKAIYLTPKTIAKYAGRPVNFRLPFNCNHTDGFCERCAGYGNGRLLKYMPEFINIGTLSTSKFASKASQFVLSTKHLLETVTRMFKLPPLIQEIMMIIGPWIIFDPSVKVKGRVLRVPLVSLGRMTDLEFDINPIASTFSAINIFDIATASGRKVNKYDFEGSASVPYLSPQMLRYMRSNLSKLVQKEGYLYIPLDGWNISDPVFEYNVKNNDVNTYLKSVISFLRTDVLGYTNPSEALTEFERVVNTRADVNIFFLAVVLRAHCVNPASGRIANCNTEPYELTNLSGSIHQYISMLLGFDRLSQHLNSAGAYYKPLQAGKFGPLYGLV